MAGDGLTQIGNGLYFGDSYNGNRTLAAGALGGVIGGITGALTKVPVPAGEKAVREEVFGEFIDTYANSTASGGGKSLKGSLWGKNQTSSSFINTLDEPLVVSASRTGTNQLAQFSGRTINEAVALTMKQKSTHIFANRIHPKPWLNNLTTQMGGRENVIRGALQSANGKILPNASGIFNTSVNVGGANFTIRGFINRGIPIINSIFIP